MRRKNQFIVAIDLFFYLIPIKMLLSFQLKVFIIFETVLIKNFF